MEPVCSASRSNPARPMPLTDLSAAWNARVPAGPELLRRAVHQHGVRSRAFARVTSRRKNMIDERDPNRTTASPSCFWEKRADAVQIHRMSVQRVDACPARKAEANPRRRGERRGFYARAFTRSWAGARRPARLTSCPHLLCSRPFPVSKCAHCCPWCRSGHVLPAPRRTLFSRTP
jgi:hypothetical protein